MGNKIETSYSGMFLENRLKKILDNLNKELISSRLSTKEEVANLFNKTIRDYQKTLGRSLFIHHPYKVGEDPDIGKINSGFNTIHSDLEVLYEGLSNIRDLLTNNYNTLSGMLLKTKADIAETSSKLFDYKIQNTDKTYGVYSDSFYDLSKVENRESEYKKEKAFIDTYNTNVVMPLDGESENLKTKNISISDDSIGISGNNQEVGSLSRENLKLAFDQSIDTWFEFEQVGTSELESPTVLSLKLEFEKESFFNLLDIAVAQMPNGSYPGIVDIQGSVDGSVFFDLKSLYLGETETDSIGNEVIQLGESAENPNGGNQLYFAPRKLKFLSIKILEDSSFFIRTSSGTKYRRAIGIRELTAKSQKFKNEGQFITKLYNSNKEISKISIETDEYSPDNFKTDFKYFISVDNGQNWDEIGPTQKVEGDAPEVLNYNIDFLAGSKKTDTPVNNLKLKADFKLEEGEDSTTTTSSFKKVEKTEFTTVGPGQKYITLEKEPYGIVNLYNTNYGSVGREAYFKIPNTSLSKLDDRYLLQLPLDAFPSEIIKKDQEYLYIDNYVWTRVDEITSSHGANEKIYEFDYINNIITFQRELSGGNRGKKPEGDIFFKLEREKPALMQAEDKTFFKTTLDHDGIKENISIYSISDELSESNFRLKNKASVHRLGVTELESIQVLQDDDDTLDVEKSFINGVIELTDPGDYSIDKKRGVLYTFSAVGADEDAQIKVFYKTKKDVAFSMEDGEIYTEENIVTENREFSFNLPMDTLTVDLGYTDILEKSVVFIDFPEGLDQEVKFSEIDLEFNKQNTSGKYAIDYKNGILYLQNKIEGKLTGKLENSNYYIEYNISKKISDTDYEVSAEQKQITFSDSFISSLFNATNNDVVPPSLLKVEYVYAEEVKESSGELLPYTTPFLRGYKIKVVPKELL